MLCVIETHPIQYHAPVWRSLQQNYGIQTTVIYGSDFSLAGYLDEEFGTKFAWSADLLSGYTSRFLSTVKMGGASNVDQVKSTGLSKELINPAFKAILLVGYSPKFHWDAFCCAKKTGLPIIFRAETTDHANNRGWVKSLIRDTTLRLVYSSCHALLPVGQRSWEHYNRLGFAGKAKHFSPYCVDCTPFRTQESDRTELRNSTRKKWGIDENAFVVMYCGKLSRRKGVDLILEAVKILASEIHKPIVLLLVGDGECKAELLAKASMEPRIPLIVTGFQQQDFLSGFYHASDIFILPSREGETWGLVVNEALHHGLPVVVSEAVGCALDLVIEKNTGQVFKLNNLFSLVKSIRTIYNQPWDQASRNQCKMVANSYSVSKAAMGIARCYQEVICPTGEG